MSKGILRTVEGDVTNPQRQAPNEIALIPHCCNNLGVMGAGVALALKKKWPQTEKDYLNSRYHIGTVSYTCVYNDTQIHTIIANMVAQDGIINESNPKPLKYYHLANCMDKVYTFVDAMKLDNPDLNVVIHCPEFGGLRAGGNFEFVLELIKEIWIERGVDVVIYEFEADKFFRGIKRM